MPGRPRALLFDIDGTLLESGGAGRDAFVAAWADVFGGAPGNPFATVSFVGRTDPGVVAEIAGPFLGREPTPAEVDALFARYLEILPIRLAAAPGFRLLPGVPDLLRRLAERPDVLLGLCSGNLEEGARIKLRRGGIDHYFAFGGFGSDDGDRAGLTRIARDRAVARAGGPVDALVIGDSPLDARAARANGLPVALVATGWSPRDALLAESPDLFFESFLETEAAIARLTGRETK